MPDARGIFDIRPATWRRTAGRRSRFALDLAIDQAGTANAPADRDVNESWRKALLVCGILSSLLYGAMIAAIGSEGYSRISQTPRSKEVSCFPPSS
jgi:hypothetical protein